MKKITIIHIISIALIVVFFIAPDIYANESAKKEEEHFDADLGKGHKVSIGQYFDLPKIVVNLKPSGPVPAYISIKLVIQMVNEGDRAKFVYITPMILDGFSGFLRDINSDFLKGSIGTYRLREELLLRASTIAAPLKVDDILIREIIVR